MLWTTSKSHDLNLATMAMALFACSTSLYYSVQALGEIQGCPESDFVSCVTRLRLRRVPFDKNMLNVVFNVTTEAKLRHTCIGYTDIMPCFRDRIIRCGNERQRRMLDEVTKMVRFLCLPMAADRQKLFLKHVQCIGRLLQLPVSSECDLESHRYFNKITNCRNECNSKRDFLCMLRVWVSEQSLCTLVDIGRSCGSEAANFYEELQINVFNEEFPIVCAGNHNDSNIDPEAINFLSAAFTLAPTPTHKNHSATNQSIIESRFLVTAPPAVPTSTQSMHNVVTTGHQWWVNPKFQPDQNVYNPGANQDVISATAGTTSTESSAWQKWMEFFVPSTTESSLMSTTLNPQRRFIHSTVGAPDQPIPWKPWYLGGNVDTNNMEEPADHESKNQSQQQNSQKQSEHKPMEEFMQLDSPAGDARDLGHENLGLNSGSLLEPGLCLFCISFLVQSILMNL